MADRDETTAHHQPEALKPGFDIPKVLVLAAYVVLGAVALFPFTLVWVPPLADYPNHLARMSILAHAGDGSPTALNYAVTWRLVPNLAMDLVVPVFARFLSVEQAGWLFIVLTLVLLMAGTIALHRVLYGKVGLWPLCALLFLYNAGLSYGLLNYLFGLAIALLGFSAWIATRGRSTTLRLLAFSLVAATIFLLHLFSFGVYGLLVASYEGSMSYRRYKFSRQFFVAPLISLLQFIPSGIIWMTYRPGGERTAFGDYISSRIEAITSPFSFNIPPAPVDLALEAFALLALPIAVLRGETRISPEMKLPIAVMVMGAALMPIYISGGWGAHLRLPIALAFILVASTCPPRPRRPLFLAFAAAFCAIFAFRIVAVSQEWRVLGQREDELRHAMANISEGSRVLGVIDAIPETVGELSGFDGVLRTEALFRYWHWTTFAVLDRGAFVPSLFHDWTPVEASERNAGIRWAGDAALRPAQLWERAPEQPSAEVMAQREFHGDPVCCIGWPHVFNYIVWIDWGQPPQGKLPYLTSVASGSFFHIYRVDGEAAASSQGTP